MGSMEVMPDLRRLAIGTGVAVAAAAVAVGTGKYLAHRARTRPDPDADEDFDLLADLGVSRLEVATRDGGHLVLLDKGQGRPVLFVPGVTLRAGIWRYQFALTDHYRVVALNQRGHGESRPGEAGFGLDRLADDLADVLEALDLRDVVIVGHSMGGMATMRFAHRHPLVRKERVAGLVLVATTAEPVLGFGSSARVQRLGKALDRRGASIGWERVPAFAPGDTDLGYSLARLSFGDRALPHHVDVTRRMLVEMQRESMHRSMVGLLDNDELPVLHTVDTPTLVVVGSRDTLTPPRHAKRIAAALPDAELVVLPGAGHQVMLERPQELNALVEGLLLRTSPRP